MNRDKGKEDRHPPTMENQIDNEMESGITGTLLVLFVAGVAYGGTRDADPKQLQRMSNGSLLVFSALLHPGSASLSARNSFKVYPLYIYIPY